MPENTKYDGTGTESPKKGGSMTTNTVTSFDPLRPSGSFLPHHEAVVVEDPDHLPSDAVMSHSELEPVEELGDDRSIPPQLKTGDRGLDIIDAKQRADQIYDELHSKPKKEVPASEWLLEGIGDDIDNSPENNSGIFAGSENQAEHIRRICAVLKIDPPGEVYFSPRKAKDLFGEIDEKAPGANNHDLKEVICALIGQTFSESEMNGILERIREKMSVKSLQDRVNARRAASLDSQTLKEQPSTEEDIEPSPDVIRRFMTSIWREVPEIPMPDDGGRLNRLEAETSIVNAFLVRPDELVDHDYINLFTALFVGGSDLEELRESLRVLRERRDEREFSENERSATLTDTKQLLGLSETLPPVRDDEEWDVSEVLEVVKDNPLPVSVIPKNDSEERALPLPAGRFLKESAVGASFSARRGNEVTIPPETSSALGSRIPARSLREIKTPVVAPAPIQSETTAWHKRKLGRGLIAVLIGLSIGFIGLFCSLLYVGNADTNLRVDLVEANDVRQDKIIYRHDEVIAELVTTSAAERDALNGKLELVTVEKQGWQQTALEGTRKVDDIDGRTDDLERKVRKLERIKLEESQVVGAIIASSQLQSDEDRRYVEETSSAAEPYTVIVHNSKCPRTKGAVIDGKSKSVFTCTVQDSPVDIICSQGNTWQDASGCDEVKLGK